MSAVIAMPNMRTMSAVRRAVNERARSIHASDAQRRHAVAQAFSLMQAGHTSGWAVSEACRALRGVPAVAHRGPTPPSAA
jgi:hypothetical protein